MSRLLPLPSVDESISKTLQREMKKKKIKVITGKIVENSEYKQGKLYLTIGESSFIKKYYRKRSSKTDNRDTRNGCLRWKDAPCF
jgi:pyruvate/2-oxoglutarate dehydrogenase complex dihydrolipoamide dehydrogenase (E3) component